MAEQIPAHKIKFFATKMLLEELSLPVWHIDDRRLLTYSKNALTEWKAIKQTGSIKQRQTWKPLFKLVKKSHRYNKIKLALNALLSSVNKQSN